VTVGVVTYILYIIGIGFDIVQNNIVVCGGRFRLLALIPCGVVKASKGEAK